MDIIEELKLKLKPTRNEVGMYNLVGGCGIHARDDGCLELYAGKVGILIDGESGTVTINGRTVNLSADKVTSHVPPAGFSVSTGPLNPRWLPAESERLLPVPNPETVTKRSPLTSTISSLQTQLVCGTPDPSKGQYGLRLEDLVKPKAMFETPKPAVLVFNAIKDMLSALKV